MKCIWYVSCTPYILHGLVSLAVITVATRLALLHIAFYTCIHSHIHIAEVCTLAFGIVLVSTAYHGIGGMYMTGFHMIGGMLGRVLSCAKPLNLKCYFSDRPMGGATFAKRCTFGLGSIKRFYFL